MRQDGYPCCSKHDCSIVVARSSISTSSRGGAALPIACGVFSFSRGCVEKKGSLCEVCVCVWENSSANGGGWEACMGFMWRAVHLCGYNKWIRVAEIGSPW